MNKTKEIHLIVLCERVAELLHFWEGSCLVCCCTRRTINLVCTRNGKPVSAQAIQHMTGSKAQHPLAHVSIYDLSGKLC